jgi:hypothetical protein
MANGRVWSQKRAAIHPELARRFFATLEVCMDQPITLHLTGPRVGGPTLDDLIKLAMALTGRPPTAEEIERARRLLAARSRAARFQ